jgi:hypothetical protein
MSAGSRYFALRTGGASNGCWATTTPAKVRRENRHPLNISKMTRTVRADNPVALIDFMSDPLLNFGMGYVLHIHRFIKL